MDWTERQREVLETKGKNILVAAAAGSGKTAVLVERIKRLLLEERVPLRNFLVVTFTNAAASEMREKIVRSITQAMSGPDLSEEDHRFLRTQLNEVHRANISTFHSFALDVIRSYFQVISLEPDFKICDDAQKTILQGRAMDALFEARFEAAEERFLRFLRTYADSRSEQAVKNLILDVHRFIQSLPDPFAWLHEAVELYGSDAAVLAESPAMKLLLRTAEGLLQDAVQAAEQQAEQLETAGLPKLAAKAEADRRKVERIAQVYEEDPAAAAELCAAASWETMRASKEEKEGWDEEKKSVQGLRDRMKKELQEAGALLGKLTSPIELQRIRELYPYMETLESLVLDFDRRYTEEKKKERVLDFSDIEHNALKILEQEEVAQTYREKFEYIFIDEYQDSNLIQEALIARIRRETNLFMVGDVKQSIYKFRLAEPEIFIRRYEAYRNASASSADCKIDLNQNFRSKEPILDFINALFRQIMNRESAGMEYDRDAALYPGVSCDDSFQYEPELHLVFEQSETEVSDEEIRDWKKAEIEAGAAVHLIRRQLGTLRYDEKSGQAVPIRYRDMVVLLRSRKTAGDSYCKVLRDAGIPCYMESGEGFFDNMEIGVFVNLLKIIDNEKQDVPLISVLYSPLFDFSLEELSKIRLGQKTGAYSDAFLLCALSGDSPLAEKCASVRQQLLRWRERNRRLPLETFLWELLEETGYYSYLSALPAGAQRKANVDAFVGKAAAFEASGGNGLFGFINYIEVLKSRNISIPPAKLVTEGDDVVRIMTVHQSKGLEIPVVIVGGLGRQFHQERKTKGAGMHKDLGLALHWADAERHIYSNTLFKQAVDLQRMQEARAEEIRVLYVALTRARDRLLLLGTVFDEETAWEQAQNREPGNVMQARCYLDLILAAVHRGCAVRVLCHDRAALSDLKQAEKNERFSWRTRLDSGFTEVDAAIQKRVDARLTWRYPQQAAIQMRSKYSVSELAMQAGLPTDYERTAAVPAFFDAKAGKTAKMRLSGAERGSILHKIMERIPFTEKAASLMEVTAFAETLIEKEILTRTEVDAVDLSMIADFFRTDLGKRACRADCLYKETMFNLRMEKDGESVIVQGIIDCFFRENGKWVLLDYKSNRLRETDEAALKQFEEYYRPQLMLYKKALEEIKGIEPDEVYLYLFGLRKVKKL